jgi:hypothetical protein
MWRDGFLSKFLVYMGYFLRSESKLRVAWFYYMYVRIYVSWYRDAESKTVKVSKVRANDKFPSQNRPAQAAYYSSLVQSR